jgi:type I restriction enzyme M protein
MVVPEGILFRGGAFTIVKKQFLEEFNLKLVVRLPSGAFAPYSDIKTALLVFERPGPTTHVLYHELPLSGGLKKFSKGSPIDDRDFAEARAAWRNWSQYRRDKAALPGMTPHTWIEPIESIAAHGYDLTAMNPNSPKDEALPPPAEITADLLKRSRRLQELVEHLDGLLDKRERV